MQLIIRHIILNNHKTNGATPIRFVALICLLLIALSHLANAQVITNTGAHINITKNTFISSDTIENQTGNILNNGTIDLADNFHNYDTTQGNGTINIGGNWRNTGVFIPDSSLVSFNGTKNQTITKAGGETFFNLTLNNTGVIPNNKIQLPNNVNVSNLLTMTSGEAETGSNKLYLTNPLHTSLTYNSTNQSRVIGYFERAIGETNDYLFPIGSINNYNPASLSIHSLDNAGSILSFFNPTNPNNNGLPLQDTTVEVYETYGDGFWSLTAYNSFASTQYDINLTANGFATPVQDITRIVKRPTGGDWLLDGKHADAVSYTVFRDSLTAGISNLGNDFALGKVRPRILINPNDTAICNGFNAQFAVSSIGKPQLKYQWQVNQGSGWSDISDNLIYSGTQTSSLNLTQANLSYNGFQYRVLITDANANIKTGIPVVLNIDSIPTTLLTPAKDTLCNGSTTAIQISTDVTGTTLALNVLYNGSITGSSNTLSTNNIIHTLTNPSDYADSVKYGITPTGPMPTYCVGKQDTAVMWIEPTTKVAISPKSDTICSSTRANAFLTSVSIPTREVRFRYSIEYPENIIPGDIEITSSINNNLPPNFNLKDLVVNHTDTVREVKFIITSYTRESIGNTEKCTGLKDTLRLYVEPTPRLNPLPKVDTLCNGEFTGIAIYSPTSSALGSQFNFEPIAPPTSVSGYSTRTKFTKDSVLIQAIRNESNAPKLLQYLITPYNLNEYGLQHCVGKPDTANVWINPSPAVNISLTRDTVCNNENILFTITPAATFTTGRIQFDYDTIKTSGDATKITNYTSATSQEIANFAQTLNNLSDTVQWVRYRIHPFAINTRAAGGCDNGTEKDSILHIEVLPDIVTQLVPREYIGGWNVSCNKFANGLIQTNIQGGKLAYPWIDTNDITYQWSDSKNTKTVSGLSQGIYYLSVTDPNNCKAFDTVTLTEPDTLQHTFTTVDINCDGGTDGKLFVKINGGTPSYKYNWTGASGYTSTSDSLHNLGEAEYYVTITDTNGCKYLADTSLIDPDAISWSFNPKPYLGGFHVSCYGEDDGEINIEVTGKGDKNLFKYKWESIENNFVDSTKNITNLKAGVYYLTVIDAINCSKVFRDTLKQPDPLVVEIDSSVNYSCKTTGGGFARAIIKQTKRAGGYQFLWDNGIQNSIVYTLIGNMNHRVDVKDTNGCTAWDTVYIDKPLPITASLVADSAYHNQVISCNGASDGKIMVRSLHGIEPFTYTWLHDNNLKDSIASGLPKGSYTVYILDNEDCKDSAKITIDEPTLLVRDAYNIKPVLCAGKDDGIIEVKYSGATPPYRYDWSHGPEGASMNNLFTGNYTLTVSDANNCKLIHEYFVNSESPLKIGVNVQAATCDKRADGIIEVTMDGGVPEYDYNWNKEGTFSFKPEQLYGVPKGYYSLTVTDFNNCTLDTTIFVGSENNGCMSIPNAFSPNNDGYNDFWVIQGVDLYTKVSVEVYNRNGKLIFTSNDYKMPWDGKFNNAYLPTNSYYYIIKALPEDGIEELYKGIITIIQ